MKLFYATGSSSLFPHIVLHESGLPFDAIKINEHAKEISGGGSFRDVNPLGTVPALVHASHLVGKRLRHCLRGCRSPFATRHIDTSRCEHCKCWRYYASMRSLLRLARIGRTILLNRQASSSWR